MTLSVAGVKKGSLGPGTAVLNPAGGDNAGPTVSPGSCLMVSRPSSSSLPRTPLPGGVATDSGPTDLRPLPLGPCSTGLSLVPALISALEI